ncbi:MAG: CPXCG motif-containing cysteine-rich protein [Candidatus Cloacimonetes bacterium]|nr:CPXCG motif-containing cysteine-rich protein [Candidatus Cloacimonadota bacterium]
MSGLEACTIQCPCCWEEIEILVDCSVSRQEYVEDCSVCCRPLVLTVCALLDSGVDSIAVRREDD